MFDRAELVLFITAASVLVLIPGPNTLFVVARSVEQGRTAGLVSSLGVQVGTLVHVAAAALGISALLVSSAAAFTTVKYAGAAYLIYLGIRTWMNRSEIEAPTDIEPINLRRLFVQGAIVNILNPKSALFFLAFLPQFIDVDKGSVSGQIFVLGLILVGLGTLSDLTYALLSGSLSDILRRNGRAMKAQRNIAGGVYIGLGMLTAFSGSHRE